MPDMGANALAATSQIFQYYTLFAGLSISPGNCIISLCPGCFGGAMENLGGITYYERNFCFDPKSFLCGNKARYLRGFAHKWRTIVRRPGNDGLVDNLVAQ